MSTVQGQRYLVYESRSDIRESVEAFEKENVSTQGGFQPPTFGFVWMRYRSSYQAKHLLTHFLEHWIWGYRYIFC